MTTDEFIKRLGACRRRIKILRDDNRRLWESRYEWKQKHAVLARENTALRRRVRQLEQSRDMWRARAPHPSSRTNRPVVELRPGDLELIMGIPARD